MSAAGARAGIAVPKSLQPRRISYFPYRYHLRLRLARALDLTPEYDDLSALALDLGFSSHSHFAAAFKQAYGRSPSAFQQSAR